MQKSAKQLVMRPKFRPQIVKAKAGRGSYTRKGKAGRQHVDD